jgi:hypothetical protein
MEIQVSLAPIVVVAQLVACIKLSFRVSFETGLVARRGAKVCDLETEGVGAIA